MEQSAYKNSVRLLTLILMIGSRLPVKQIRKQLTPLAVYVMNTYIRNQRKTVFALPTLQMRCRDSSLWNKAKRFPKYVCYYFLQQHSKDSKNLAITVCCELLFITKLHYFSIIVQIQLILSNLLDQNNTNKRINIVILIDYIDTF